MFECDVILRRNSTVSETSLLRKGEEILIVGGALLRKVGDTDEYDVSCGRTRGDVEWLEVSGMRRGDVASERRQK